MNKKLLIATRRKGKLDEFKAILKNLNFKLLTLTDINFPNIEPEENGKTFKENAEIKAKFYGKKTKLLTLADDSGLIVNALPNKLGVRTKRYIDGSDQDRNKKLLAEMKNFPKEKRSAQFVSAVAFFDPQKNAIVKTTIGICPGRIAHKPKGKHGFGFDPIFIVKSVNKHFAQLTLAEKNKLSHRAKALEKMIKYLKQYI